MCIRDTFAVSYNESAIFPWTQQQLLRAKPAYAWLVPRKWHQRKAGMELCHFLLALRILLRGNAILANVLQTANTSKITQHLRLPRLSFSNTTWQKRSEKWRLLGNSRPQGPKCLDFHTNAITNAVISETRCLPVKVAFKVVKAKGLYGHRQISTARWWF